MAAEFPSFTSTESDDSTINTIISQAFDDSVLEQIVKLNSSRHLPQSPLPIDLETRFQKLKSFPITNKQRPTNEEMEPEFLSMNQGIMEAQITCPTSQKEIDDLERDLRKEFSSLSPSSIRSSRASSSPSPPRRTCCFGCSSGAKKAVKKRPQKKQLTGSQIDSREQRKSDEILTDFSTFSFKEQQRKLKKALKEEVEVNREAENVVQWVKQASARMDAHAIDELIESDSKKLHKGDYLGHE